MENLLDTFKCFSDETRLRIVMLLHNKELCVCELCNIMNVSQPKVSKHLSKLREVGIVKDERDAKWIFYYLNIEDEVFNELLDKIAKNISKYPVLQNDFNRFGNRQRDYKELCKN